MRVVHECVSVQEYVEAGGEPQMLFLRSHPACFMNLSQNRGYGFDGTTEQETPSIPRLCISSVREPSFLWLLGTEPRSSYLQGKHSTS